MLIMLGLVVGFSILCPMFCRKHFKLFLAITTVTFTVLAYYMTINSTTDVFRYMQIMPYMRQLGYQWTMKHYAEGSPLFIWFLYGLARLNHDHLLPACTVALTYGFSFALLYKASKRFHTTVTERWLVFVFFLCNMNFFYVANVLRIYIAFAIMAYFLYMDLIEKKNRWLCFLIYVALCYFHYAVIVILLLRLVMLLTQKFRGFLAILNVFLIPLLMFLFYEAIQKISLDSSLIRKIQERVLGYQEYDVFGIWQFIASLAQVVTGILLCVLAFWICNELLKHHKSSALRGMYGDRSAAILNRSSEYAVFGLYTAMTILAFVSNYQFVLRTPYFYMMLLPPVLFFALSAARTLNPKIRWAVFIFVSGESILYFIYLLLYVYRGNISI